MIRAFLSLELVKEWLNSFPMSLHPVAIARMTIYRARALEAERWIEGFCRERSINPADVVFYTWWYTATTWGAVRFGRGARVITRVHGVDLYPVQSHPQYIPFRETSLSGVSSIVADSDRGAAFFREKYRDHSAKASVGLLGTSDPGFEVSPSLDGVFRIVSCSFMVPVKRLNLLVAGIGAFARSYPESKIEWTHYGDGPDRRKIEKCAQALPANAIACFPGYPGNDGLFQAYRQNAIDVFVNCSSSEGTPVSLIEAISVGMPIVATAVGGNSEVVTIENGQLLPENPEPEDFVRAFSKLMDNRSLWVSQSQASRARWRARYSAELNYCRFVELLLRKEEIA